jgi:hypothetical protein
VDVRRRFEGFAAAFAERARPSKRSGPAAAGQALRDDYWQELRDLFTRDLTSKDLQDLLERDARESVRFFVREVDFEALRARPWHVRYPLTAWRVFLATAYRLSPSRRALFAFGALLLLAGWLRLLAALLFDASISLSFLGLLIGGSFLFQILLLELRDKLALKGDLEVARQIQFGLLPFEPYEQDGLSIRVAMRPANTVGGDYFDLIGLGGGRLAVVLGDVAGKGMPAALLMALLQASLRTLISAGFRGGELLAKLNAHLFANIPSNRLITLFYAELDPAAGTLCYVNAGHNAPLLLRAGGGLDRLPATAVALGVMPDAEFQPAAASLAPCERLFLYTDGVVEAFDARDEEYGELRLEAFLATQRAVPPAELVEAVVQEVLAFGAGVPPHDDMTLMVVARGPSG